MISSNTILNVHTLVLIIIIEKKEKINQISSKNEPHTLLNGLLDARTVLISLLHNVGSGMMLLLSCRKFG